MRCFVKDKLRGGLPLRDARDGQLRPRIANAREAKRARGRSLCGGAERVGVARERAQRRHSFFLAQGGVLTDRRVGASARCGKK